MNLLTLDPKDRSVMLSVAKQACDDAGVAAVAAGRSLVVVGPWLQCHRAIQHMKAQLGIDMWQGQETQPGSDTYPVVW